MLHQHWYTYPVALPVRRNPQNRSFLTVASATSAPPFQTLRHQRNICHTFVNHFTRQTIPTVKRKYFFVNILCIKSFCPQNKNAQEEAALQYSLLKQGRRFDYWNQPLKVCMRICYLDCHEAGLCCYIVIHIENLLRPWQPFYFHLWPIYWHSLVVGAWLHLYQTGMVFFIRHAHV
jgi:hypothetical protein